MKSTEGGSKSGFLPDLLAGGLSGVVSKTVTAPIERVKLLLQTEAENQKLKTKYKGIIDCFVRCVREEGVLSLWRGNGINVIRYFPTQALNFAFKDRFMVLLKVDSRKANPVQFFLANIAAGGLAGSCTTCFVHPLDFARTRLSVDLGRLPSEREYLGLYDCLKKVWSAEGYLGLYPGFGISVGSIFLYRGLYFGLYDYGKKRFLGENSSIWVRMVLAQASVILAELISYPGDTLKRKLFMQSCKKIKQYTGVVDCFKQVYQRDGIKGFWKGSYSNVLRGIGSSLCLILYDECKGLFSSMGMYGRE